MIFLVLFMGLVGQLDVWLSLIETPAVPRIIVELGLTPGVNDWVFGLWQGIFGVIVFLVFLIGWFADSFGRRKGILLLLLGMGIPAGLIILVPPLSLSTPMSFYLFLLLYSIAIMGTTSNLWEVPIAEESPANRRALYGSIAFLISVIPLSSIIGKAIVDNPLLGWRWSYGVMFFLMLVLLVFLYFMKETGRWEEVHASGEKRMGFIEALKQFSRRDLVYVILATVVYLTWSLSFKLGTTWGGHYYENVLGMAAQWSTILTVAGLMLPVSAIISGVLLERIGRRITLFIGSIGSIISFVGLGLTTLPFFFWGIYFFMAMVLAWIYIYVTEIFPTKVRSTGVGVAVMGSRLAYVVAPLLSVVLLPLGTNMDLFWIVAGIIMVIPLLSLVSKPYETKGQELETIDKEK